MELKTSSLALISNAERTDEELRNIWKKAGGKFYGPHVETGNMEEQKLFKFLRSMFMLKTKYEVIKSGE